MDACSLRCYRQMSMLIFRAGPRTTLPWCEQSTPPWWRFAPPRTGISLRLLPWITALALATTTAARCSFYFSFRLCWRRCSRLRSHAVSPCPPFNVAGNFLVEVSKLFCINMRFAALPLNTFVSLLLVLADHGINKFISERQTKTPATARRTICTWDGAWPALSH